MLRWKPPCLCVLFWGSWVGRLLTNAINQRMNICTIKKGLLWISHAPLEKINLICFCYNQYRFYLRYLLSHNVLPTKHHKTSYYQFTHLIYFHLPFSFSYYYSPSSFLHLPCPFLIPFLCFLHLLFFLFYICTLFDSSDTLYFPSFLLWFHKYCHPLDCYSIIYRNSWCPLHQSLD